MKHRNAVEKIDHEVAPFFYVQHLSNIERTMWKRAVSANQRTVFASLRDGYTLKQTLCGILRGESLEKADLSDLLDIKWKVEGVDLHEIHILVLQIAMGKQC